MDEKTHAYLKAQLEDPALSEWEKNKIRKKLGIYIKIGEEDFEKIEEDIIPLIEQYIDSQKERIYIKSKKRDTPFTLPEEVEIINWLCLFYGSLTLGDYQDRTQVIPKMEYNMGFFWKYKTRLIQGLLALNLNEDATFMEVHFTTDKYSETLSKKLETYFWNESYKKKLQPFLVEFIKNKKTELLKLQEL